MTTFNPAVDLQLPWASSSKEDKRFKVILFLFLFFLSSLGVWMHGVVLPKVDRKELEKAPASIAKVVIKKKKELERVPLPVIKAPEVKKVDETKQVEKKPDVEKPKQVVEKPKVAPTHAEKVAVAKEVAKTSGLLAMKDDLAAMRSAFAPKSLAPGGGNGGIKVSTALGNKGVGVSRTQIVGKATGGSGGISVSSGASSGLGGGSGGGIGGGNGSGRGDTNVDSVTLGGAIVDTGGDVADAIKSAGVAGNRSEESIRATLDSNKSSLYAIYNRALREDPSLQGKVVFKLVIEPDGSVSSCSIVSSELNDSALGNKLVSRMKLINFGPDDVTVTTTQWAIDFLPN